MKTCLKDEPVGEQQEMAMVSLGGQGQEDDVGPRLGFGRVSSVRRTPEDGMPHVRQTVSGVRPR